MVFRKLACHAVTKVDFYSVTEDKYKCSPASHCMRTRAGLELLLLKLRSVARCYCKYFCRAFVFSCLNV